MNTPLTKKNKRLFVWSDGEKFSKESEALESFLKKKSSHTYEYVADEANQSKLEEMILAHLQKNDPSQATPKRTIAIVAEMQKIARLRLQELRDKKSGK